MNLSKKLLPFVLGISLATFLAACSDNSVGASSVNKKKQSSVSKDEDREEDEEIEDDEETEVSSSSKKSSSSRRSSSVFDDDDYEDEEDNSTSTATSRVNACSNTDIDEDYQYMLDEASIELVRIMGSTETSILQSTNAADLENWFTKLIGGNSFNAAYIPELKATFKKVLTKYPNNCAAKFGYGLTLAANVYNDEKISELNSIYGSYFNLSLTSFNSKNFVSDILNAIRKSSAATGKSFTKASQEAMKKTTIPALDSAIKYFGSVVAANSYVYNIETDDYIIQLDQSEFSMALGIMYATKAILTAASSVNLEVDQNGSYDWINYYTGIRSEYLSAAEESALSFMVQLLQGKTMFSQVYSESASNWKKIPSTLQSAVTYIQKSIKYSLADDDQDNDVYVVGDGPDADISTSKLQNLNTALNAINDALTGPYAFDYASGKSATINIPKYFSQTEGIMKFMPKIACENKNDPATCSFVDLDGYETISLIDAKRGNYRKGDEAYYFYFPDPTFGGTFPKFTQESAWNFFNSISE